MFLTNSHQISSEDVQTIYVDVTPEIKHLKRCRHLMV